MFSAGLVKVRGGGKIIHMSKVMSTITYNNIISIENLLEAWQEFLRGKRQRKDVQIFERDLMSNILALHEELKSKNYQHSKYQAFNISDPKPRSIHKAEVRDRLLHHAVYRVLYPYFDTTFISDSYSCRINKGTHKAIDKFKAYAFKVSKNHTRTCWVLKCDVRKFFASIDHEILLKVLRQKIIDPDVVWLLERIITSFDSGIPGKGLPLGNLTSQLLVNIYMNEFDQHVKHNLKQKYYIRYADDFVVLSNNRLELEEVLPKIESFLRSELKLKLHPDKVFTQTFASGVDFLGWIHFSDHRVLRTVSKRRMLRKTRRNPSNETVQSYLGLLKHGNTRKLRDYIQGVYYTHGQDI